MEVNEKQSYMIEQLVTKMRHQLTPSGKTKEQLTISVMKAIELLPQLSTKLYSKITHLDCEIKTQKTTAPQINNKEKSKQNKILLYYFQLVNLALIQMEGFHSQIDILTISNLHIISNHFSKTSSSYHSKTLKALLILYFNLLKKFSQRSNAYSSHIPSNTSSTIPENIISFVQSNTLSLTVPQNPLLVFKTLQNILHSYFQSNQNQNAQNQLKFKQQTEWIALIFELLPTIHWKSIHQNFTKSFISNYLNFLQIQNHESTLINSKQVRKDSFNILHMMGNFLNLVIQSRTSTELIQGYECPIEDITKMYSNPNIPICNLKLNQSDALFLCQLLIKYYNSQKRLFREMFKNKDESLKKGAQLPDQLVSTRGESENEDFHKMLREAWQKEGDDMSTGQLVLETINILNNILFLGGYNPKLQQIIYNSLFANNTLPQFLQLSYLIYNQRRLMSKYNIKLNMAKTPEANLSKILSIDYENTTNDQRKCIFKLIGLEVKVGQLSVLLRLMTNLVHINAKALSYFQQNIRYLHMVMSLTHQSEINLTMKNWAVLFIKNCCDSQKLRDEINKVKIQMKVDQ